MQQPTSAPADTSLIYVLNTTYNLKVSAYDGGSVRSLSIDEVSVSPTDDMTTVCSRTLWFSTKTQKYFIDFNNQIQSTSNPLKEWMNAVGIIVGWDPISKLLQVQHSGLITIAAHTMSSITLPPWTQWYDTNYEYYANNNNPTPTQLSRCGWVVNKSYNIIRIQIDPP